MIARWLIINVCIVVIILFWSISQGYDNNSVLIGKLFSQVAIILFLINLNMYFVFLFIRRTKVRNVKIKLAKISKKMMKYHIPIAFTATTLIAFHAILMLMVHNWNIKTASGVLAVLGLSILLFSGYLRRKKATGKRRKFHYTMAFIFFGIALIHIFL